MILSSSALFRKQLICIADGRRLGTADAVMLSVGENDSGSSTVGGAVADGLLVRGRLRWLGLMGKDPDLLIDWKDLLVIGEDAILISGCGREVIPEKRRIKTPFLTRDR